MGVMGKSPSHKDEKGRGEKVETVLCAGSQGMESVSEGVVWGDEVREIGRARSPRT